jgi:pyridoxamine 5'-phosphate oxidase
MSELGNPVEAGAMDRESIRAMRRSYGIAGLAEDAALANPIDQFRQWLVEAAANPLIVEANAMVLSVSNLDEDSSGHISSRTVLLKDVTADGFSFFTNYQSRKARAMATHSQVTLLFPWYAMERQVSISGRVEKLPASESDDYFATRPWGSQIGAWASTQSAPLASREELEARYAELATKYPEGSVVPRPEHWGGYLVRPTTIEFWQGRHSRLHDRLLYIREADTWNRSRLYP